MDSPTTPTPDFSTTQPPATPPDPGGVPFEPATPEDWAPTEATPAGQAPEPATARRTVSRATLAAGIALAAIVGIGGVGLAVGLSSQDGDTGTAGAVQPAGPSSPGVKDGRTGRGRGPGGHGEVPGIDGDGGGRMPGAEGDLDGDGDAFARPGRHGPGNGDSGRDGTSGGRGHAAPGDS